MSGWIPDQRQGGEKRFVRRKTLWAGAMGAAVATMLVIALERMLLLPVPVDHYIEEHEPSAVAVMKDPATEVYRFVPAKGGADGAYVWINGGSQEMLVLIENPKRVQGMVYQGWASSGDRFDNMGLLKYGSGRAHLYVKTDLIVQADNIIVSMEPYGGIQTPGFERTILFDTGTR